MERDFSPPAAVERWTNGRGGGALNAGTIEWSKWRESGKSALSKIDRLLEA